MQTFLPYVGFHDSARVLDNRRLGKQRLETKQILTTLLRLADGPPMPGTGWHRHPAVLMWRGFEHALANYGVVVCAEWARRGFLDTIGAELRVLRSSRWPVDVAPQSPPWLGDARLHLSHQSNLLRKNPEHYGVIGGWITDPSLPYHWPTNATNVATNVAINEEPK